MSLDEAVDLVLFAFENGTSGDVLYRKHQHVQLKYLLKQLQNYLIQDMKLKLLALVTVKNIYETLLTNEECAHAYDMGEFYRVPCDKRDLNYDKLFWRY